MFRRYLLKMLCSFFFLFLFTMKFVDLTFSLSIGNHPLLMGWEGTGIPVTEMEIEGWKKINKAYTSSAALEEIAVSLQKRLKLRTTAPPLTGEELDFSYVNIEGCLPNNNRIIITLQSIKGEASEAETFCGVMALFNSELDLSETLIRLKRAFEPVIGELPLAVTLSGVLKGRISEGEAYSIMKAIFRRLQVSESAGSVDWEYGRWSAWTNLLDGAIIREGTRINLEFAYQYEEEEDVTHITLATPALPGFSW
ncbi:MAG TPA: hypothetical protein DEB05_11985 [Firmicutes bacterium]|jgi:hypothetical protein|nr:hypothetical protein [Bacillota bacterium]HBT17660.1 hypothetical protein [Bacillota bacterium]